MRDGHKRNDWDVAFLRRVAALTHVRCFPFFDEKPLTIAAIFSSDLVRASETARIIKDSTPHLGPLLLFTTTLLRERNFGDWQGFTGNELQSQGVKKSDEP